MYLTTERLLLREFIEDDWPAVLAYQSDQRYLRFYQWTLRTEEDVRAFIQTFIDQHQEQPRTKFQLAICLPHDGLLIGNCGIRMQRADATEAETGYELAPEHWGQGYATEAARAIVEFGFKELNLHRIWAHCVAENIASAHVLEKLGMQLEGRLRENEWLKGRWSDRLLFGILAREWNARERVSTD